MRSWGGRAARGLAGVLTAVVTSAAPALAQDQKELGWFYSAELTAVFTSGNATVSTFGLGAGLRRVWDRAELSVRGGGLRTESGTTTRTAVGTVEDFQVVEDTDTELTAEHYFVRSRVDHSFSDRFFAYGGVGWERNTFAGFDSRITSVVGVGTTWVEDERTRFKTNYGATYTVQDDIVEDPTTAGSFGGLQLAADFWRRLTATTSFESLLIVDENLAETEDLRADWTNALLIEISEVLAFRASLQLLFDNLPSLATVDLDQPAGTPTGSTVRVPLDEIDTRFTIALVANF